MYQHYKPFQSELNFYKPLLDYLMASVLGAPKLTLAATFKKKSSSKSVAYIERFKGRNSKVEMNGKPVVAQHTQTSTELDDALMIISFTYVLEASKIVTVDHIVASR
jgi:hypothetical protein